MPENQPHPAHPYRKDRFIYGPATDSYTGLQGQTLVFSYVARRKNMEPVRVYRPPRSARRVCPAMGVCTKDRVHGRLLSATPND